MGPDVEEGALEKARKLQGVSGSLIESDPQAGAGYNPASGGSKSRKREDGAEPYAPEPTDYDLLSSGSVADGLDLGKYPAQGDAEDMGGSIFDEEDKQKRFRRKNLIRTLNAAQNADMPQPQQPLQAAPLGMDTGDVTKINVFGPNQRGVTNVPEGSVEARQGDFLDPEGFFGLPPAPAEQEELDAAESELPEQVRPQARPWAEKSLPENTPLTRSGGLDTDAEVAEATLNLGKVFPETRGKILGFLGATDDDSAERIGMALLGFGSGLLQGGPDFGAALGAGFSKGADQYVKTKMNQQDAALNDLKTEMATERLDMEREAFNERKQQAALDRANQKNAALGDTKTSYFDPSDPRSDARGIVTMDKPFAPTALPKEVQRVEDAVKGLVERGWNPAEAEDYVHKIYKLTGDEELL
jgi:hypothetical protein